MPFRNVSLASFRSGLMPSLLPIFFSTTCRGTAMDRRGSCTSGRNVSSPDKAAAPFPEADARFGPLSILASFTVPRAPRSVAGILMPAVTRGSTSTMTIGRTRLETDVRVRMTLLAWNKLSVALTVSPPKLPGSNIEKPRTFLYGAFHRYCLEMTISFCNFCACILSFIQNPAQVHGINNPAISNNPHINDGCVLLCCSDLLQHYFCSIVK
mmetsp:Transcript_154641/g.267838  ORF Transcript_154641/g.267838 Transcript_154641/m.267838 type:complete len:211 (+) Transcript_154641:570-1202(+)